MLLVSEVFGIRREIQGEDLGDEGAGLLHLARVRRDPDLKRDMAL